MTAVIPFASNNTIGVGAEPVPGNGLVTVLVQPPVSMQADGRPAPPTGIRKSKLEREGAGAAVTRPTTRTVYGRLEDGVTHSLTLTPMARLITTCIPLYQPDGKLSVPPDEWAALRAIVEDEGGTLDFEETSKRGFIVSGHKGLPVYAIAIEVPDGIDEADIIVCVKPALNAIIRRNLNPTPKQQPA